jgi:predicted SpoU family rRNA methylase
MRCGRRRDLVMKKIREVIERFGEWFLANRHQYTQEEIDRFLK